MLPEHIHKDDIEWFQRVTLRLHPDLKVKACIGYGEAYKAAYEAETRPELYKENAARYAANTRLNKWLKLIAK